MTPLEPYSDYTEHDSPNVWPVVADVFIGFLVLVLIATIASYADAIQLVAGGHIPPPAKEDFRRRFEEVFAETSGHSGIDVSQRPRIKKDEFSRLGIYFPASFLFRPCNYQPMDSVANEIDRLRDLLREFTPSIQRVRITGHTDHDPIGQKEDNLCRQLGITTNWQLSARRAIAILERLAPEDRSGLDPEKVSASAMGPYDPVKDEVGEEDKQVNRRIELVIEFHE